MRNRKPKAAFYDPYMETLGGGEQYMVSVMKTLEDEGYDITLFWKEDIQKKIHQKFGITFRNLHIDTSGFHGGTSALSRWWHLGNYEVFFYITDGSYFFSGARHNYLYAMVPRRDLYTSKGINALKTRGWRVIANSHFTASHLRRWGMDPRVHYPLLSERLLYTKPVRKEKIILSVGRFFRHLHKKNHEEVIYTFNRLQEYKAFKDYKLILAGGLRSEDKEYFDTVKKLAKSNHSIELRPNISHDELYLLYEHSMFYWHFAGLGVNEREHPEQVEHLGITPLEAMAAGCVVFCFKAGGPREIIEQGKNGFLFTSEDELVQLMRTINQHDVKDISKYAQSYVKAHFSLPVFKTELQKLLKWT